MTTQRHITFTGHVLQSCEINRSSILGTNVYSDVYLLLTIYSQFHIYKSNYTNTRHTYTHIIILCISLYTRHRSEKESRADHSSDCGSLLSDLSHTIQLVSFSRSESTSASVASGSLRFDFSHVVILVVSWSGSPSASASEVSAQSLSVATAGSFFRTAM